MSTWYDVTVNAYGNEEHLAKCLNVKTEDIRGLNQIELSFGQKNRSGVDLESLAKNNSGLILLVQTTVECHSGSVFLLKYDTLSNDFQYVPLERFDYDSREFNKKLLLEFPNLEKELMKNKFINWKLFCYDEKSLRPILDQHDQYQDTVLEFSQEDFELDNAELADD